MTLTPHLKHVILACIGLIGITYATIRITGSAETLARLRNDSAQQQLKAAQMALQQAQADRQAEDQRYQQTVQQVLQANSQLAKAMADRNAALQSGLATLQNAPQSSVAARWEAAVGLKVGEVQVGATGLTVGDSAARQTVARLETGLVAEADLADTKMQLKGVQGQVDAANMMIQSLRTESSAKDVVLQKADAACEAKVALVKVQAKKRSVWIVVGSVIAGVVLGRKL